MEEEKQLLVPFFARARSGEIATATEVKLASARTGWARGGREHELPVARSAWMAPASCRARNTPKGVKKSRNALKKLCGRPVQAAAVTREAHDERPVLILAQHASPLWPDLSIQTVLGAAWHAAFCPCGGWSVSRCMSLLLSRLRSGGLSRWFCLPLTRQR